MRRASARTRTAAVVRSGITEPAIDRERDSGSLVAAPLARIGRTARWRARRSDSVLVAVAFFVMLLVVWRAFDVRRPLPHACARRAPNMLLVREPRPAKALEPAHAMAPPAPHIVSRASPMAPLPARPQDADVAVAAPAPGSCAREVEKCAEGSVGSATTCFNLGRMYETGMCGAKDVLAATGAFGRGCDLGDRSACRAAGRPEPARAAAGGAARLVEVSSAGRAPQN